MARPVDVRLSEEEYSDLEKRAAALDMSVPELAAFLVRQSLQKGNLADELKKVHDQAEKRKRFGGPKLNRGGPGGRKRSE